MPARYQREIEEILEHSGDATPRRSAAPASRTGDGSGQPRPRTPLSLASLRGRVSPGKLMIASIGILLSAWLLSTFNVSASGLVAWAGIVLFILAYALFFILPPKGRVERRWRGQPIDLDTGSVSWRDRLRRWFRS